MPPRVKDIYEFYDRQPPEQSERCKAWVARIKAGWKWNGRISRLGYYSAAEYFGVHVWEYINVLQPLLTGRKAEIAI